MSAPVVNHNERPNCLIVLSSAIEGVSAQSFIKSFTLASTAFHVDLATQQGKVAEFVSTDEAGRRWLADFKTKSFATPISLSSVDARRYQVLLIPHSLGAAHDLANSKDLASVIHNFISQQKPICAIGMGVAALCCAMEKPNSTWSFTKYCLTAPSVFELARGMDFSILPIVTEDFIKEHGATYSASGCDNMHVVIDRHLVTGQNEASTITAVQNLILLSNQRC
ncbi:PREDICTED: Parkinson disease 7 domain-containing protein 1-like isoform X2 [Priapulus caudatus]|uniref:Glutamine amidotransferase-like class 1 domain-containing protein 1 n=1 Tax=Priapulus caudatus TaxID=37621 RepID=A0ABM1E8K0_PRICU|nr:PREDICTED: Parkinson disease 7 domain-containing protein 1-like isoform X2 [Priapulus caudatus]